MVLLQANTLYAINMLDMIKSILTSMPLFVCFFWLVLFLLQYRKANRARKMLTFFLFISTLLYFAHCAYFNFAYSLIPFTDTFYQCATLSVYPLYLLYIKLLTNTKPHKIKDYLILLPGVLIAIAVGFVYFLMTAEESNDFLLGYLYNRPDIVLGHKGTIQKVLHLTTSAVFALQMFPILFVGSKKIYVYKKKVDSYYSYTENKNLSTVKILLFLFVATSIISFIMNLIGKSYFAGSMLLLVVPSVLFSVLLFTLAYISYKLEYSATELDEMFQDTEEPLLETQFDDMKNNIVALMEKDRLFLQQDLKISDLTALLGTNRNYIYNAINVDMGISFSEFINRYRVEYAKQLLIDNPKANISEIISDSGFSSEVSFYRNFKHFVGTTPTQWLKKQRSLSH